jgi:hypothetical protein
MALGEHIYRFPPALKPELNKRKLWQGYLLSQEERRRIDNLIGSALLDQHLCERLINRRDVAIFAEIGLSPETQQWLCSIEASSLTEFAQAIAFR